MNGGLKWKLIIGFILAFLAGGATGVFFSFWLSEHYFLQAHEPGMLAIRMKARLRHELNLTPEQQIKIAPIVDKTAAQLEEIRKETGQRVHETFENAHKEMGPILTDEQKAKLEQLRQQHRRMHMFPMHGPGRPPPPGG